ncbi:MAG: hypothetical protein L6Q75_04140 [Burkholderiaceae bacterium]|nr:hypothetical protein [Burkholderiaceae bacterium]
MTPFLTDLLARGPDGIASAGVERSPTHFFAQGRLALDRLAVEVEGFGPLPQPLSPEQALSEPAHFGLREQTLLDTAVRHSGEIDADRLALHS